jgi:prephenate dehydrogenase
LTDAPAQADEVAARADLLVLAAPPIANVELLGRLGRRVRAGALVTDVGSVKRAIVSRAESLRLGDRFAGSHPMAGSHGAGFAASRADLFRDAVVYVTPTGGGRAVAGRVAAFWREVVGARTVEIEAGEHDAAVALSSHLPQVAASLLANFLATRLPADAALGPGARDTTRLAGSSPALWTEILLLNRDRILEALRNVEEPLGELERALEVGDARALEAWLGRAAAWRRGIDA